MTPSLPDAAPAALASLVDYQSGAIVSNTLVKDRAGTVTLFAFDDGEELSEHTTPFDAIVLVIDGAAVITIGGRASAVQSGEIIRLPANVPHAVRADERFKMLLIMIRAA